MGFIAAATNMVGAGIQAKGAIESGKAQQRVKEFEARQLEMDVIRDQQETAEAIRRARLNNRRAVSGIESDVSASGVLLEGSALDAMIEAAGRMELEVQDEARVGRERRKRMNTQARLRRWEGQQIRKGAKLESSGILMSGVSRSAGILGI